MAGFVSRLVACLVAVVAVLQLVHLVLLNKLESTRLQELRRLQQQQQYHHLQQQQQQHPHPQEQRQGSEDHQNLFEPFQQETGGALEPGTVHQNPHHSSNSNGNGNGQGPKKKNNKNSFHYQETNWRSERAAVLGAGGPPDVPEQELRFDHLLREDQGAIMDSTGEFRIVFDAAGPHSSGSSSPLGSPLQQQSALLPDKEPIILPGTNPQTDDFSIDDENFEGLQPPLDVTLVTYGDFQDSLESLIPLVTHWNGPMSVAIFSPSASDMQLVLEFMSQARLCHGPTRKYVSFHLVFPLVETHSRSKVGSNSNNNNRNSSNRFEKWRSESQQKRLSNPISGGGGGNTKLPISLMGKSCQSFRDQINKYYQSGGGGGGESKKGSERQNFPVNLLRNVARKRVGTEYSFVTNMNMIPSRDMRTSFQQLVRERVAKSGDEKKTVFVVPAFEIKSGEQIPSVKSELLGLVDKHKARPFQFDLCWKCQMYTDYETWQRDRNSKSTNKLGILFEVLWKDPWEPFFISDNSVPLFDERFRHNSISRTSQLCELHVAGYKFAVLNNAFLVHRGYAAAVPSSKNQEEKGSRSDADSSRGHFRQFKIELKEKYPHSTRRCY